MAGAPDRQGGNRAVADINHAHHGELIDFDIFSTNAIRMNAARLRPRGTGQ